MESRLASSIGLTGGGVLSLAGLTGGSGYLDPFAVIVIALEDLPTLRAACAGKAGDATDGTCAGGFFSSDCLTHLRSEETDGIEAVSKGECH